LGFKLILESEIRAGLAPHQNRNYFSEIKASLRLNKAPGEQGPTGL